MEYIEVPLNEAYRLLNTGPLVMISTVSKDKKYNTAPIAWACPAAKEPTRVLIGVGKRHKTFSNIEETGVFSAGIPNISQVEMIKKTGSVSGNDTDKFNELNIAGITTEKTGCRVPEGMIGNIECRVIDIFSVDKLALIVGEAVYAVVDKNAYDGERLLSETPAGKTAHHLGSKRFITFGDKIIE